MTPGLDPARETRLKELVFLQRLALAASATPEPDAVLSLIIQETTGALSTDVCSVYLWDAGTESLVLTATNGLSQAAVGTARMKLGEGVTGWVAHHRTPLVVPNVRNEPRFKWIRGVDQERFTSMLSVPILAGPRMVGVLNMQTILGRIFAAEDVDFLAAIAAQVAGIIERSELQRRLEQQLRESELSHQIHARFTQLALAGAGLPIILEAIESLAGGPVILYDSEGRWLLGNRGSQPASLELPVALRAGRRSSHRIPARADRAAALLLPVRAGDAMLAWLLALEPSVADDPRSRVRALEHGVTVLALELAKERASAEVERRLRGDLLEALLTRGLDGAESVRLAKQAERLGFRISPRTWMLVFEPDDEVGERALRGRPIQDRVHAALSDQARRRYPGSLVAARSPGIVVLIPSSGEVPADPGELEALLRFAELLLLSVREIDRRISMSAGIGNRTESAADLPRAHDQARQAVKLMRHGGRQGVVTSYRNLGAFRLLLEIERPESLRRFVTEMLGDLERYEEGRETPLLQTLEELILAHWNQREAARRLHIHINTLLYRVQRIEKLTGFSLADPEMRVALAVAVRARALLRG
jgi:sugar diacid utilization regulator/putative methionine-R-sulfoxide reductase with GAF domain